MQEIRLLKEEEYRDAAELSEEVFGKEEQTSMKQAFPKVFSPALHQCYGAFENRKLVAFIGLVPSVLRIGKARLYVYSLGSVCTHPDHRGKGLASRILEQIQTHIIKSGASLLFVSGDRPLYRRMGCFPFGTVTRFTIDSSTRLESPPATSPIRIREQCETDWFTLKEFADHRKVGFEQSVWDLADLIHAEGYASRDTLRHRVFIAEKGAESMAYAVIGASQNSDDQPSVAIEWGGVAEAVIRLFMSAVHEFGISRLEIPVPAFDAELRKNLLPAKHQVHKNEGTVCLVNPKILIKQLRPYLAECNSELNQRLDIEILEGRRIEIRLGDDIMTLSDGNFVALIFDQEIHFGKHDRVCQTLRHAFFPIPCPYLGGLNYV